MKKQADTHLGSGIPIPFDRLYLDPNNPRLGLDDRPGYENANTLFDQSLQEKLEQELARSDIYDVDGLAQTIINQGWMPIDNIIVWPYPNRPGYYVVVEGNTRTSALRRIRRVILDREQKKLDRMEKGGSKKYSEYDLREQREHVERIKAVISATEKLWVLPLDAKTAEELEAKLPRVLAVRHITGAKEWGNYAEDLWLLNRYFQLFKKQYGQKRTRSWDRDLIKRVGDEASLKEQETRRKLHTASAFSHFTAEFEDQLPESESFGRGDYYLFENIFKRPFVRASLGFSEDAFNLPEYAEKALFYWIFRLPRGSNADENENVFYRHENVINWDQMKRYDDKNGTGFAMRFDPEKPEEAPLMREAMAEWLAHKARKKPQAVLDDLIRRLSEIPAETLLNEGEYFRLQLEHVRRQADKFLKVIKAAAA